MKIYCPYCESEAVESVTYDEHVTVGRMSVLVTGLRKVRCADCESESVPVDMFQANSDRIEAASMSTAAAVSRGLLRKLRECWGVSQREASRMFGAGSSAFAKWESGQARLSTPAALLVQCAVKFPPVMEYLASLARVRLNTQAPLPFHHDTAQWQQVVAPVEPTAARNEPRYVPPQEAATWRGAAVFRAHDGAYFPMKEAA